MANQETKWVSTTDRVVLAEHLAGEAEALWSVATNVKLPEDDLMYSLNQVWEALRDLTSKVEEVGYETAIALKEDRVPVWTVAERYAAAVAARREQPYFVWGVVGEGIYTLPIRSEAAARYTHEHLPGSELVVSLDGDPEWLRFADGTPVQARVIAKGTR